MNILITGAGKGIGFEIAKLFSGEKGNKLLEFQEKQNRCNHLRLKTFFQFNLILQILIITNQTYFQK